MPKEKKIIHRRVILQSQTILQHFYKLLMWPTFYWFSSRPTINITFSFTNNLTILVVCKIFYKIVCISSIIHAPNAPYNFGFYLGKGIAINNGCEVNKDSHTD